MTQGQQRAIRELERLREVSDGCFNFTHDAVEESKPLVVGISIRIGLMETRVGGLQFREREEFVLLVPSGFPFDQPVLMVRHQRFARFPHVVWAKVICLYQTSLEWNPADGLYGFFDRLKLWLDRAAINDMDPVDGPLEPPHHATDFSQVTFVIRANVPVPVGQSWLGFAELTECPNRMEVVGWRGTFEGLPDGQRIALAIMLPDALPMEFPTHGGGLFSALVKQGFSRASILWHLGMAALVSPEGEPVYLVIGLPMRRAVDGTPRLHIAVWCADATAAGDLRTVLDEDGDTERLRELRQKMADVLFELFEATKISWCRVMEDRKEIVVRRDAASKLAWFLGKRALVLGCGALGSWAAELIARAGAAVVDLVDNGIVQPGLLARQNFSLGDIGASKATALAGRLRAVGAPGLLVRTFHEDAHGFVTCDPARFTAYDVVLDCTASHLTQMKWERDWRVLGGQTPPLVSMVTDATAQYGLCAVVPRNSSLGPWDAYVRLKYRLTPSGSRAEFSEAFYDPEANRALFQPEPGCSDPTFSGSTADASIIAASSLNLACAHGLSTGNGVAMAFGSPASKRPGIEVVTLDEVDEFVVGIYRVRIARKLGREARAWVRQNNRLRTPAHETGGILWGLWDDAVGVIWIFDISGPPSDSQHDPGHFRCGVAGTTLEHNRRLAMSHGTSGFIGFWHTHPDMVSHQSGTDIQGMAKLVSAMGDNQRRALMLIYGRSGSVPTAGIYVYESRALTETRDYVEVGSSQVTLRAPIV
ncbi:MAG: ThiF family adenylyltransferase [Verrucomicrobiales bacterium]|nr:ThiF family adenylyltransferase [Verrucomicrobiales bacterium]